MCDCGKNHPGRFCRGPFCTCHSPRQDARKVYFTITFDSISESVAQDIAFYAQRKAGAADMSVWYSDPIE